MKSLTTLPELGAELALLRKQLNLTQLELAQQVGLGQSTLARFESGGVAEFGAGKLLRLLGALNHQLQVVPANFRPTLDTLLADKRNSNKE
jgi:HTH-type transcriptional regulator/antitoxin HipB